MLGFKSADNARVILGGIELVHMLRKQQAKYVYNQQLSLAEQFHLLAAYGQYSASAAFSPMFRVCDRTPTTGRLCGHLAAVDWGTGYEGRAS